MYSINLKYYENRVQQNPVQIFQPFPDVYKIGLHKDTLKAFNKIKNKQQKYMR